MKKRIYDLGSNQYRARRKSDYKKILGMYFFSVMTLISLPLYVKLVVLPQQVHAQTVGVKHEQPKVASRQPTPTVTPTPTATPLQDKEIAYIREVFGADSDKALLVLTVGKPSDPRCPRGENPGLNPQATNHNDDGINSTDYGLFQINDHWQGVTNTDFLFDYKINTLMAKKIFNSWNHTFQAWTCGKVLGL